MDFSANKDRIFQILTQRLLEEKSLTEISHALYDELQVLLNIHRLGVAVLSDDRKYLTSRLNLSVGKLKLYKGYQVPIESSSLKSVISNGRPRIIPDLGAYLKAKPTSVSTRLIVSEGMQSSVTLPLISNNKPIGVLFLSSQEKHAFQENHVEFLHNFISIISLSLEKALIYEKLESTEKALNLAVLENQGLNEILLKKKAKEGNTNSDYPTPLRFDSPMSWQAWEREIILYTLSQSNGKIYGDGGAAELLALAPTTLQSKMKRLGIRKNTDQN